MTKIKVSTLTGPLLNYWVGKANNLDVEIDDDGKCFIVEIDGIGLLADYSPSTDWSQGGPIIEREIIGTYADSGWREDGEYGTVWEAHALSFGYMSGDTLLIAAMRAFVASKFGEEVDE